MNPVLVVFDLESDDAPFPLGVYNAVEEDLIWYRDAQDQRHCAPYDCVKVVSVDVFAKAGGVSGATYRIHIEHRPDPISTVHWIGRIIRLSDDQQVTSVWGKSSEDAIAKARSWLRSQNVKQPGLTLLVDDEGEPV